MLARHTMRTLGAVCFRYHKVSAKLKEPKKPRLASRRSFIFARSVLFHMVNEKCSVSESWHITRRTGVLHAGWAHYTLDGRNAHTTD